MVKINLMGDVMLAELIETYRRGITTLIARDGIDPFEHVRPVFEEADFNVVNLECVLSNDSIHSEPFSELLKAPEAFARFLFDNKINVVNLANNHALDHGRQAFDKTVRLLRRNGVTVLGYDTSGFFQAHPAVVEAGGVRIGLLGYNISNYPVPDRNNMIDRIVNTIHESRSSVDKLVVSMHWGEEYTNIPPPYIVEYGKRMLSAGCDILHGHHSHYIQGVVKDQNRLFAPSLGNFVFDQLVHKNRISAILRVEIHAGGELAYSHVPYYQNDRYQPVEAPQYLGYIEELASYVKDSWIDGREGLYADRVAEMVKAGHRRNRIRMRVRMLAHFWNYMPHFLQFIAMKRSKESKYSVIKDDMSLVLASKR